MGGPGEHATKPAGRGAQNESCRKKGGRKMTAWWTEDLQSAAKAKQEALRKWLKARTRESRATWEEARRRVKTLRKRGDR